MEEQSKATFSPPDNTQVANPAVEAQSKATFSPPDNTQVANLAVKAQVSDDKETAENDKGYQQKPITELYSQQKVA